jgi:hypothetical protein
MRHRIEGGEPSLAQLLAAAGLVEHHDLEPVLRVEIRRWIVERQMAVLADTGEDHIDHQRFDEAVEAGKLSVAIGGIAVNEVKGADPGQMGENTLPQISPETRRMRLRQIDVFVEMESEDARPVNVLALAQRLQHLELTGARRQHDDGTPACCNRLADRGAPEPRGLAPQRVLIRLP